MPQNATLPYGNENNHVHDHTQSSCCSHGIETRSVSADAADAIRRKWFIRGMDCASCAKKIENALSSVEGVSQVRVVFATDRLLVNMNSAQVADRVEAKIRDLGYRLEDSGSHRTEEPIWKSHSTFVLMAALTILATLVTLIDPEIGRLTFYAATAIGIMPFARKAFSQATSGTWFSIESLMTIAATGAMVLGENVEAMLVLLLFSTGELLEGFAGRRARSGIQKLMNLTPETATRIENDQRVNNVPADFLQPGDIIEMRPGDRLPVDAEITSAMGIFDESALTGESMPVIRESGEKIQAGSLVVDQVVRLKVVSEPGDNAIDRIIQLIEEAEEKRAPIARLIDQFSAWYTPLVMGIAAMVAIAPPLLFGTDWQPWLYKALTLLLIACPCALVVSIPAAVTSALAAATRFGALVKGGAALEQLRLIKRLAFDKTGTLTEGKPRVTVVESVNMTDDALIALAAAVEQGSSHPLANAIVESAKDRGLPVTEALEVTVRTGEGVEGEVHGQRIRILAPRHVNPVLLAKNDINRLIEQRESEGNTVVVVLDDDRVLGLIGLADTLRDDAVEAIANLKALGIDSVMLTGDNRRAAAAIADKLGIDFRAELMPEDKVAAIQTLQRENKGAVAMVGDGINDAPALKAAELGIAMGRGSDVALETADAALTHERLPELARMIRLSQATARITRQNIALALGINMLFLLTTLLGMTGLMAAVLSDAGGTVLVTLNALRLMRRQ